jgi:ankyrin repeat protein
MSVSITPEQQAQQLGRDLLEELRGEIDSDYVLRMIGQGADLTLTDREGSTALMLAAVHGKTPIISALLRHGADVNRQGRGGNTGLHLIVASGKYDAVRLLVDARGGRHHSQRTGPHARRLRARLAGARCRGQAGKAFSGNHAGARGEGTFPHGGRKRASRGGSLPGEQALEIPPATLTPADPLLAARMLAAMLV